MKNWQVGPVGENVSNPHTVPAVGTSANPPHSGTVYHGRNSCKIVCSIMPLAPFWVRNPRLPIFRGRGCSASGSLLPSCGEAELLGKEVAWCLEVRCELSVGNQCIVAGHQDKLVSRKAGHSISWHCPMARSHHRGQRDCMVDKCSPQDQDQGTTECSSPRQALLSVAIHSANSSCSQPHQGGIANTAPSQLLGGMVAVTRLLNSHRGLS